MKDTIKKEAFEVCRTCLHKDFDASIFSSVDSVDSETNLTIKQKLRQCIPEVDLNVIPNSVICSRCCNAVNFIYNFKNECLKTEEQIYIYQEQVQHAPSVIKLSEVIQVNTKFTMKIESEVLDIKEELNIGVEDAKQELLDISADGCVGNELAVRSTRQLHSKKHHVTGKTNNIGIYYQCYTCSQKMLSGRKLLSHLNKHSDMKLFRKRSGKILFDCYKCYICSYVSRFRSLYDTHKISHFVKIGGKPVVNPNNRKKFVNTETSKIDRIYPVNNEINIGNTIKLESRHVLGNLEMTPSSSLNIHKSTDISSHPNKTFKCSICHCLFKSRWGLSFHLSTHRDAGPFQCAICEKKFLKKPNLKLHLIIHSDRRPFKCSICERQFKRTDALKCHLLSHSNERLFKCPLCDKPFKYKNNLKTHILVHKKAVHKCTICGCGFVHRITWVNHLLTHEPHKCSICELQFNKRSDLKTHMLNHRPKKNECSICELHFHKQQELMIHKKSVHKYERWFKCSACEKRYKSNQNLKRHMVTHTREKQFKCALCDYQFHYKSTLYTHMRIHTNEKPFKCSLCEYQCRYKGNLKIHMVTHTGEKPFKCSICERGFSQPSSLKGHILTHTVIKPFKCTMCGSQYKQNSGLKRHMRIVHNCEI